VPVKQGLCRQHCFWEKWKLRKWDENVETLCLSLLSLFSQNNRRNRQLLFQNDIILEVIIQNIWSRYQIEACEVSGQCGHRVPVLQEWLNEWIGSFQPALDTRCPHWPEWPRDGAHGW
jgi:hypothetical protein